MRAAVNVLLSAMALSMLSGCETTTTVNGQPVATPSTSAPTESDTRKRAQIRLQLAANYYQQRQFSVALDELRSVLQAEPNSAPAYGLMGLIYMEIDDRAQAESNFARALRLEPENPELLNNYGWFLCRTQREREALGYFDRAAANRLYATPGLPLQNAGICLGQLKDYKGAEAYLRKSFEVDASSAVVKYQLARLYLQMRELERANFYYGLLEKTTEPTSETLWLGLRLARASGDVRGQQQLADELRRRFPSSSETAALRRGAFDE